MTVSPDFSFDITSSTTDTTDVTLSATTVIDFIMTSPMMFDYPTLIEDEYEKLLREYRLRITAYRKAQFSNKPIQYNITRKKNYLVYDKRLKGRHRNHRGKEALR